MEKTVKQVQTQLLPMTLKDLTSLFTEKTRFRSIEKNEYLSKDDSYGM